MTSVWPSADAALHRLETRGAFAQPLERGLHRVVVDGDRGASQLDVAEVAGVERRHHVEGWR